jgi:aspartyl-tRNA(Asn)/glutamyl-tRNA(Gln) amidotransferase subunit A
MKSTASAAEIAQTVKSGETSARAVIAATLGRIEANNGRLNAFTDVTAARAMARADRVDADVRTGKAGPLAGVPFGAKNLFDLGDVVTRAGSKINRDNPPAKADAYLVAKLEAAGAICVGALNMGEYAYDFTGENAHDGPAHNPHGLNHMTGGSSSGSAAAVAGGLVPIALGTDTNGSIRLPASFCGLFGLKPTYGRLSRHGTFPFAPSLDHVGPLARSVTDLALAYDAMQGFDEADPAMTKRPMELIAGRLEQGGSGYRVVVADGYFTGEPEAREAVAHIAKALEVTRTVTIPDAAAARAAAFLITMAEGGSLHLERLRERAGDFDPDTRDRLIAGAMLPGNWIDRAQKFRRAYREKFLQLFQDVDAIVAPATPMRAPLIGQKVASVAGLEMPLRPNIGIYTQPISFIGLPVVAVPVWIGEYELPIGVQIIAPPWREDIAMRLARRLEKAGAASAPVARGFADPE